MQCQILILINSWFPVISTVNLAQFTTTAYENKHSACIFVQLLDNIHGTTSTEQHEIEIAFQMHFAIVEMGLTMHNTSFLIVDYLMRKEKNSKH